MVQSGARVGEHVNLMYYGVSRVYGTEEVGNISNFRFLCGLCMERTSLVKFHCCTLYSVVVPICKDFRVSRLGFYRKGV